MEDFMKYSLFDEVIKEAEDDEGSPDNAGGDTAAANDVDTNGDGKVSDDEANAAADEAGEDADEDFNVDTDIPDGEDEEGGDDAGEDNTDTDTTSSTTPAEDDEPKQANTDIFDTLTAEEQIIKIRELKLSYKNLYATIDDILNRINNMEIDEDTLDIMSRITMILTNLRKEVSNYFINVFNLKSFLENDIKYNEFLAILKSTAVVVDELSSKKAKIFGAETTKADKK